MGMSVPPLPGFNGALELLPTSLRRISLSTIVLGNEDKLALAQLPRSGLGLGLGLANPNPNPNPNPNTNTNTSPSQAARTHAERLRRASAADGHGALPGESYSPSPLALTLLPQS